MIAVIDYGMGNLRSVQKALEYVGARAKITDKPREIVKAERIVFPGVGSFGAAMKELKARRLDTAIKEAIAAGTPFLGLCLGLQLLFEKSEEAPGVKGLGVLEGSVRRFAFTQYAIRNTQYGLKVPHMGWNSIKHSIPNTRYSILNNVPDNAYMYFVHSYYAVPKDKTTVITTTDYGIEFASGIAKDNIVAFQFHPEKSQALGLGILKNFVKG